MKYFRNRPYVAYILPAFVIMSVLIAVPTGVMIYYSLTDYEIGYAEFELVGLENYRKLMVSPAFWHSVRLTVVYATVVTAASLSIGFLVAKLMDRHVRVKALAFIALVVPIAMTPSIAGQIWGLILNAEYGVLNFILGETVGITPAWLASELAFASVIGVSVWQSAPFAALILYAGLQSLPAEPFEAARTDGANRLQILWHITLPLMRMSIMLAFIFVVIDALRIFDIPFTLTQGGPGAATELLGMHIYRLGFSQTGWIGQASAASVALMLLTAVVSLALIFVFRRNAKELR